ncbi:unnamed protein product [Schistosoma spindalis]|nr:unnamed protein product [Schistosoma spindale]
MNQLSSIHVYHLHVNEHNTTLNRTEWKSTTVNQYHFYYETSLIYKHSNEHIPIMIQMHSFTHKIELYSRDVQLLSDMNNQYHNSSSICGSDSDVDSGTGIIITSDTYLPISSYEQPVTSNMVHENLEQLHYIWNFHLETTLHTFNGID